MLKLETLRSAHELDRLKSRWTWLAEHREGTLFQSWELNRRAARWFAARETPHVILAESGSGLAIIPAVRRERELALIGETLFDYRDVLSAGDSGVLEGAWRELSRTSLPLELTALRGDAARERWKSLQPAPFCNAPTTRRADIAAGEFVAAHHKSAKASRRLAREGLRLVRRDSARRDSAQHESARTQNDCGLRSIAQWVYRRKAEWRGNSENLFLNRRRQNFMLYVVYSGILDCTIWSYETDCGDVSAALVTFRQGSTRHFYTIHHDARWERFSPGQAMIFDVTRETLAEGLDVDFMTGEYPYKNRLATAMVPLYRVSASAGQLACWSSGESRGATQDVATKEVTTPEAATPAA